MTIKSLTITENAYEALKTLKYGDESFSDVILRLSHEKVGSAAKFFGALAGKDGDEFQQRVATGRARIEKEFIHRTKR